MANKTRNRAKPKAKSSKKPKAPARKRPKARDDSDRAELGATALLRYSPDQRTTIVKTVKAGMNKAMEEQIVKMTTADEKRIIEKIEGSILFGDGSSSSESRKKRRHEARKCVLDLGKAIERLAERLPDSGTDVYRALWWASVEYGQPDRIDLLLQDLRSQLDSLAHYGQAALGEEGLMGPGARPAGKRELALVFVLMSLWHGFTGMIPKRMIEGSPPFANLFGKFVDAVCEPPGWGNHKNLDPYARKWVEDGGKMFLFRPRRAVKK